jgi:nucleoid-associated protein YgaU
MRCLILLLTAAGIAACSTAPDRPAPAPVAAAPERVVPDTYVQSALAAARARIAEAKELIPGWTDADALLAEALRASGLRTIQLATEARERAERAMASQYLIMAQQELQVAQSLVGLNNQQLGVVRAAEVSLLRGEGRSVYTTLKRFNAERAAASKSYAVQRNDTLWSIAGKPHIYDNPRLWPLIWNANRDRLPDPKQLRTGQQLQIKPNPTVKEVVEALEFSRRSEAAQIRIGPIREASPGDEP